MNSTSTLSRPRRARPAALAIIYPKVGNVLRVPLRRTATGGPRGCAQHPERQFIVWFNRMAAARPGFPMQIKSILLLTREPLCPSCHRTLAGYLSRFHLAGKLRLRTTGPAACGCAGPCNCAPLRFAAAYVQRVGNLLLDEVLFEGELEAEGWWERAKDLGQAAVLIGALALGPKVLPQPLYDMAKAAATAQADRRKRQQTVDDNTPKRFGPGQRELGGLAGSSVLGGALAREFEFEAEQAATSAY